MQLVRLIYVSRMTESCDMEALQEILEVSRRKNKADGVTGVLCYDPAFFLQCLEGPREKVNELYARILRDDRHQHVTMLEYADIDERTFGDWAMGLIKTFELDAAVLSVFGGAQRFDPYSLNGQQVFDFLVQVSRKKGGCQGE